MLFYKLLLQTVFSPALLPQPQLPNPISERVVPPVEERLNVTWQCTVAPRSTTASVTVLHESARIETVLKDGQRAVEIVHRYSLESVTIDGRKLDNKKLTEASNWITKLKVLHGIRGLCRLDQPVLELVGSASRVARNDNLVVQRTFEIQD